MKDSNVLSLLVQAMRDDATTVEALLTDEMIETEVARRLDGSFGDTDREMESIAKWVRDRMAQQAQPECAHGKAEFDPTCEPRHCGDPNCDKPHEWGHGPPSMAEHFRCPGRIVAL